MYLNLFSDSTRPLDMTSSDEFTSLLASAADLAIPHSADVRYQSNNIVLRHQRFHFLEWGDSEAPPVLMLHGGNQSAHSWDLVSLHLADRFRVLALDQRGHGDSEWARDADYSSTAMADDASAFLREMGIDSAIVIGHSMGGLNALRLTLEHPAIVQALVLVDVGPEVSEKGSQIIRKFVTENREFADLDDFIDSVQRYDPFRSREHVERTVKYNLLQRADGTYVTKCDHGPRLRATGEHRERDDRFSFDDAAQIRQPVLIVRGEKSNILTNEGATKFANALPNGRLNTVANCGHNVHGQNTPGFLEAVTDFLDTA